MKRVSLLVLLIGCASSRQIVLPESMREQADRYTVGGHVTLFQPKLVFGPYTAKARIYTSGSSSEATMFNGQTEKSEEHDHGKFELPTRSGRYQARCEQAEAAVIKHDKGIGWGSDRGWHLTDEAYVASASRVYGCAIGEPSGGQLKLSQGDDMEGVIEGAGVRWTFAPLGHYDRAPLLAAGLRGGYVISDEEDVIGVIGSSDEATVTFARRLDQAQRDRLAAVATALLLLRDM